MCCTLAVGQFRDVVSFTGPSVSGPLLIALSAMVGASVGSSWRACAPMSLPCFFLWLEFGVTAGPGPRSLDHSGRGALCPAALLPAKALKSIPAMLHILARYAELVTFVLPPNSVPERQHSLQQFQAAQVVCLGRAFAPSANVSCEVLFTLLALL